MSTDRAIASQREEIVDAFIARFGVLPEQCEQVVRTNDRGETVFFIRKRRKDPGQDTFDSVADIADAVVSAVCNAYSELLRPVIPDQITGIRRTTEPTAARHMCMLILREHYSLTMEEIGRPFGRHHATVIHGIRMTKAAMVDRPIMARVYRNACASLRLEPLI